MSSYSSDPSRENDGIIRVFREFLQQNETAVQMLREMDLPEITEAQLDECLDEAPFDVDRGFIKTFILNGQ